MTEPPVNMEPALRVEIGGRPRGGGGCPASIAARNGDTRGCAIEEATAGVEEVVDAAEMDAPAAEVAAAADEAAEVMT